MERCEFCHLPEDQCMCPREPEFDRLVPVDVMIGLGFAAFGPVISRR